MELAGNLDHQQQQQDTALILGQHGAVSIEDPQSGSSVPSRSPSRSNVAILQCPTKRVLVTRTAKSCLACSQPAVSRHHLGPCEVAHFWQQGSGAHCASSRPSHAVVPIGERPVLLGPRGAKPLMSHETISLGEFVALHGQQPVAVTPDFAELRSSDSRISTHSGSALRLSGGTRSPPLRTSRNCAIQAALAVRAARCRHNRRTPLGLHAAVPTGKRPVLRYVGSRLSTHSGSAMRLSGLRHFAELRYSGSWLSTHSGSAMRLSGRLHFAELRYVGSRLSTHSGSALRLSGYSRSQSLRAASPLLTNMSGSVEKVNLDICVRIRCVF
jgi:hypothetical protein